MEMVENTEKALGQKGLAVAEGYLEGRGYEILERGWDCEHGHVDLVARDSENGTICFAKVQAKFGGLPEEDTSAEARALAEAVAFCYIAKKQVEGMPALRFDNISLGVDAESGRAILRHHKACFEG